MLYFIPSNISVYWLNTNGCFLLNHLTLRIILGTSKTRVKILSIEEIKDKIRVKLESNDAKAKTKEKTTNPKTAPENEQNPAPSSTKPAKKKATKSTPQLPTPASKNWSQKDKPRFTERLEKFLKMNPSDLPEPKKKQYACEKDIKDISFPKDTLRCLSCGDLYERVKYESHRKECKKMNIGIKYGCVTCGFKHSNIAEIRAHIIDEHKK